MTLQPLLIPMPGADFAPPVVAPRDPGDPALAARCAALGYELVSAGPLRLETCNGFQFETTLEALGLMEAARRFPYDLRVITIDGVGTVHHYGHGAYAGLVYVSLDGVDANYNLRGNYYWPDAVVKL